jgi:hypothetical protein
MRIDRSWPRNEKQMTAARPTLEGVFLYMIKTYIDSGLITLQDVDELLENVRTDIAKTSDSSLVMRDGTRSYHFYRNVRIAFVIHSFENQSIRTSIISL